MKKEIVKLCAICAGGLLAFGCTTTCKTPKVEKPHVPTTPQCCVQLQNQVNTLKMELEALKRKVNDLQIDAEKAVQAANRAEDAANRAETAATKAERIFEKGLKK